MAGNQPKHPRHHYAKFKDPPNDRVRIEMFLEAISDYASLQATFPLPELPLRNEDHISDGIYWIVNLHAALLRKFFTTGEQTEVHRVIDAARRQMRREDGRISTHLSEVEKYARADSVPSRLAQSFDGNATPVWERVLIELYGRHLHNDFGKWHTSKRFPHRSNTVPMYEWCGAAVIVLDMLVTVIRDGERAGVIDLDDDKAAYFTESGALNR